MERSFLIVFVCLIFVAFFATASMSDIADGLVGYWPMEGDANDASGNGNDGTPMGDPDWVNGKYDQAISLDGVDDHIALGTGASLDGPVDFSLSVWVRTTSEAACNLIQQRNGGYNGEYILNMGASHNTQMNPGQIYFMAYNGAFQWEIWSAATANNGEWHNVVAVRRGDDGFIFIDGNEEGTASGAVVALVGTLNSAIGSDIRDGGKYFEGEIDDVRIYNRALELDEIQTLGSGADIFAVEPVAKLATVWGAIKK